ncbi:hypothetical protein SPBR_04234 [Sporothrix brasiliensis 5110]|uniref:Uncharacterized protein n=1 Tax=Sporothrix brasiliensis 5110 TaxID=1398154 RepID=A0A0C2IW72_9PEZI|nr:uncharacterized protein SPBR_04234 [Sporothrix brasiliensis 5110]KIH93406.1 hypothetical protein SPBR_04234 [Sporothrix brasiliensis 5110]
MDLNDVHVLQRRPLMGRAGVFVTGIANSATNAASDGDGLPNLNLSNGTCYSTPGKQMDSRFIPCGNAAAGIQTCCWEGDNCLSDKACFGIHDGGYSTYLAGCTDAEWDMSDPGVSAACPVKPEPYGSEPWVGLAYCGNNETGHNQWIPCPQADSPTTMRSPGPCPADESRREHYVVPAVLADVRSDGDRCVGGKGRIIVIRRATKINIQHAYAQNIFYTVHVTIRVTIHDTIHISFKVNIDITFESNIGITIHIIITITTHVTTHAIIHIITHVTLHISLHINHQEHIPYCWHQLEGAVGGNGAPAGFGGGYMDGKPTTGADFKSRGASTFPDTYMSMAVPELENRPARPWSLRSELDGATATAPITNKTSTRFSIGTLLSSPPASPPPMGDLYESSTPMVGTEAANIEERRLLRHL